MTEAYVSLVTDEIYIKNVQKNLIEELKRLGAKKDVNYERWIITFSNVNEQALLFSKLRDLGIAFSFGYGWSPHEQFEDLRERGLIVGEYKRITWFGKGIDNYKIDIC